MTIPAAVSAVTEPTVVLFFLGLAAAWQYGVRGIPFAAFVLYVLFSMAVVSYLRLLYVRRVKTNWDLSDRKKRFSLMVPFLLLAVLLCSALFVWGNMALVRFSGLMLVWFVGLIAITAKVKISGHMAVLTLALGYVARFYGARWLLLAVVLPLVAWSRLTLKRHTLAEVIGGTLYSAFYAWVLW